MSKFVSQGQQRISGYVEDCYEELKITVFFTVGEESVVIAESASLYGERRL
jgi:hypothetical protein